MKKDGQYTSTWIIISDNSTSDSIVNISILGCGWLGHPLAIHLISKGNLVKGSTTSPNKLSIFKEDQIVPYLIDLREDLDSELIQDFLDCEMLIISIPPKVRHNNDFEGQFTKFISEIKLSELERVIFISSTSVYPMTNGVVSEEMDLVPDSESGKVLLKIEEMLLNNPLFSSIILRMAGLYGYDRKPGRFLSHKKQVKNPKGKVNLIHRDDCVEIISKIIDSDINNEIFNCCSDIHPNKDDFYKQAALELGLEPPAFDQTGISSFKIISNEKLKEVLSYAYKYPDPMEGN